MVDRRSSGQGLALAVYSALWLLATPLVMGYLWWRSRRQPAYRANWGERWAWWHDAVPPAFSGARPVWIHAVSVGETRAAQPLIEALLAAQPDRLILLTHMTPTGRETGEALFASRWPGRIHQQYLPYDLPWAMGRFLRRWQPRLGIVMETELWPNLCAQAADRGLPMVLVNARLSAKSLAKGRRWHWLIEPALASLAGVLAQTAEDARRLQQLGRESVPVLGNLKFDVTMPEQSLALAQSWRAALGGRQLILLASSRDGEENPVLSTWQVLRDSGSMPAGPDSPLLLIVPRHPQRFDEVADLIQRSGMPMSRRSQQWLTTEGPLPPVLLGDSMGEMAAYYGLADVAIIGGSLLPFGAQNLIEACAAGVPVIVGPHTYNFEQAAQQAIEAGAACRVQDAFEAVRLAQALLTDETRRAAMARAGREFSRTHRGAAQRTLAALQPWLD